MYMIKPCVEVLGYFVLKMEVLKMELLFWLQDWYLTMCDGDNRQQGKVK